MPEGLENCKDLEDEEAAKCEEDNESKWTAFCAIDENKKACNKRRRQNKPEMEISADCENDDNPEKCTRQQLKEEKKKNKGTKKQPKKEGKEQKEPKGPREEIDCEDEANAWKRKCKNKGDKPNG